MLLYEFDLDNAEMIKLTGVVSQVFNSVKDTGFNKEYSLTSLINTLEERGLDLNKEDFVEMIKKPPLNNLIANIKGDKIIFKGESSSDSEDNSQAPDKSTSTLEKMAKRAAKK